MDFSLLDYHLSVFYTEMSVFCCESCQCVGNYGFWNVWCAEDLNVFTDYLCVSFSVNSHFYYLGMFTVYLDFSEDMLQDKSNDVYGSFYVEKMCFPSGCASRDCFFKIVCSFVSVMMIAIHRVHSHHCHWPVATDMAFHCTPHILYFEHMVLLVPSICVK